MAQSFIDIQENMADFILIKDNIMMHKQVEFRDGMTFMRMKKRFLRNGA